MDRADAKLFAEQLFQGIGEPTSVPSGRLKNLAECYLKALDPVCCHAPERCPECPMKAWDIPPGSWMNPLSVKTEAEKALEAAQKKAARLAKLDPNRHRGGRKGVEIMIQGQRYKSISRAADLMGVHKSVINRMLRDGKAEVCK